MLLYVISFHEGIVIGHDSCIQDENYETIVN